MLVSFIPAQGHLMVMEGGLVGQLRDQLHRRVVRGRNQA